MFKFSIGSTSCRPIIRDAPGSTHKDTRLCGVECSLAFFNDEHRRLLDPAGPERRESHGGSPVPAERGPSRLLADRPFIPTRPFGRRENDGGFRPAGYSADARPGGLGQLQPGTGCSAHHLFSRQDYAAQAGRSAGRHGADEAGVPASFRRATARFHGGSWRLPENVAAELVLRPFVELCGRYSIPAKPCKTNLITTP